MIVLAYNIPGVAGELRLPRDVYLDMFAGGIRQWDDPRIKAANPGVALPHQDIVLVARQDGSGTTAAFTRHLDAMGPSWRGKGMGVGKLIDWPRDTVLAPGNEGVAAKVQATDGASRLRRVLVRAPLRPQDGGAAEPGRPVHLADGDRRRSRAVRPRRTGAPARRLGRRPGDGRRLSDSVVQLDAALSALSQPLQGRRAARFRGVGLSRGRPRTRRRSLATSRCRPT